MTVRPLTAFDANDFYFSTCAIILTLLHFHHRRRRQQQRTFKCNSSVRFFCFCVLAQWLAIFPYILMNFDFRSKYGLSWSARRALDNCNWCACCAPPKIYHAVLRSEWVGHHWAKAARLQFVMQNCWNLDKTELHFYNSWLKLDNASFKHQTFKHQIVRTTADQAHCYRDEIW